MKGLVTCDEPFARLLCQGMVLAETYYQETVLRVKEPWFNKEAVSLERDNKGKPVARLLDRKATRTGDYRWYCKDVKIKK